MLYIFLYAKLLARYNELSMFEYSKTEFFLRVLQSIAVGHANECT